MVHRWVSTCDYFPSISLATQSLGGAVLWAFSTGHCAVDSSGGQLARFTTKSSTCGRNEEARRDASGWKRALGIPRLKGLLLMRFCMVTTFYPPYHFGGDAIFIQQLSNELAKRR